MASGMILISAGMPAGVAVDLGVDRLIAERFDADGLGLRIDDVFAAACGV